MRAPALSDALTPADLSPRLTPHSTLQSPNSLPILRKTSVRAPLEMATLPPDFASLRGDASHGEGSATRIASVPVLVPARIVAPLLHDVHSSRGSLGSVLLVFFLCATQLISINQYLCGNKYH